VAAPFDESMPSTGLAVASGPLSLCLLTQNGKLPMHECLEKVGPFVPMLSGTIS
jgi:hypothetical protein